MDKTDFDREWRERIAAAMPHYEYLFDKPRPEFVGWYATCHCWEPHEGSFMGANYWGDDGWLERLPIHAWSKQRFETETEAAKFADEHDISE